MIFFNNLPDLFFDQDIFFRHLTQYAYVDVLTYTYGDTPLQNIRKVVAAIVVNKPKYSLDLRIHKNIHAKLFLCYNKHKLVAAYMGSLNCRRGYNHNIMYRMPKKTEAKLLEYFTKMWNEAGFIKSLGNPNVLQYA